MPADSRLSGARQAAPGRGLASRRLVGSAGSKYTDGSPALPATIVTVSIDNIRRAHERIAPSIVRTPFDLSETISALTGVQLYLKFENQQFTASFKERGALNRLLDLTPEQRTRGVIAMSAGNHAQA
ncbi:MAG: pyridoxal-phosphate dependent enzyme, partial [Deltaproteobacteria bacterium]|nr:pyridoxal-phosphate dependent enzyme [Deltaproteobacteria bacterium]